MSIMEYNGGAMIAMVGKGCVAIASDRRFGIQAQTVDMNFKKIFRMTDRIYLGMTGLATDVQTLAQRFNFRVELYKLQEERTIRPRAFAELVSTTLYEKRFGPYFIEPVIAGLDNDGTPFICSADLIGCLNFAKDFVVSGTSSETLYGTCEALYQPDLEPEELFETISQALVNAVDRNAVSGWGAVVHVITKEGVTTKYLRTRQD